MNSARPLKMPTRRKNLQPMPAIFRSDQRHFKMANCHATQTFFLTQHIKMILFINFVRVLGDEKGSLPHRRNKTLLTDVKLRLRSRLLCSSASLYALGHYFQVGLAGRAQALFYIYNQTDAWYDPLSGRKTLTLP